MKQFGILRCLLLYITCPAQWARNLASIQLSSIP
jgi:hypothetical protein